MSWEYCRIHGQYQRFDHTRGCPGCEAAADRAEEHRQSMRADVEEARREAAEQLESNLGYLVPSLLFYTLRASPG